MQAAITKEVLSALGVRRSKSRVAALNDVIGPLCGMYVAIEAVMDDQRSQINNLECKIDRITGKRWDSIADGC